MAHIQVKAPGITQVSPCARELRGSSVPLNCSPEASPGPVSETGQMTWVRISHLCTRAPSLALQAASLHALCLSWTPIRTHPPPSYSPVGAGEDSKALTLHSNLQVEVWFPVSLRHTGRF